MARGRRILVGRQRELALLDTAVREGGDRGRLILVRGAAGIGRTALLDAVARTLPAGTAVLDVRMPLGAADSDPFGVAAVLTVVRDHYERIGDPRLAESIGVVGRLFAGAGGAESVQTPYLVAELLTLFGRLRAGRPLVLLMDDVHRTPLPAMVLHCARQAGCLVVATCRDGQGACAWLDRLVPRADELVELGPLPDEDADALLGQVLAAPVDEAVLPALRAALGPLLGNPDALLSTVDDLRRRGRLTVVRDVVCLRDPRAPIALPAGHRLARQYALLGEPARAVLAMVANAAEYQGRFAVDDLPGFAAATGGRLADYGREVDRLIGAGLLAAGPRGVLEFPAPALAAAAVEWIGRHRLREQAARFAAHLLGPGGPGADPVTVADLITAAGHHLTPRPVAADLLIEQADRSRVADPRRAARWYHAALRHAGARHPERARVVAALLRLLPRIGAFDRLGELVAELAVSGKEFRPGEWADLADAAALSAVHTGIPVDPDLTARFESHGVVGNPGLMFAASRLAGPRPAGQLVPGSVVDRAEWELVAEQLRTDRAGGPGDLVAAFARVLGSRYAAPVDGAAAAYHRMQCDYRDGRWPAALSAARELCLTGPADTPVHRLGRIFAVEICAARGVAKRAAGWLSGLAEDESCPALYGWARAGLAWGADEPCAALAVGLPAYQRARATGDLLGADRLLLRLVTAAAEAGLTERAERLLAELQELDHRAGTPATARALAQAHGLVHGDADRALAGVELARQHGDAAELLGACLAAGRLPDVPPELLYEAHHLAERLGAPFWRARARELMRAAGITAPRNRTVRDAFSGTELRIIELIRDGRTNRQIAVDVRVSEKTVENHLTRLFARTGCRSRLELAAASLDGRLAAN